MELQVAVGAARVSASLDGEGGTVVALGHGAGGTRRTPLLERVAADLAASGRRALLFNFPYSERGRRVPDPPALLEDTVRAVAEEARRRGAARLVLGGKSMGGRIASQAVAAGLRTEGLVFLGYPLHPPGKPDRRRDAHLGAVGVPMLFLQGTRDAFARGDLLEAVVERLGARATLHRLEGGDHSFVAPRGAAPTTRELESEMLSALRGWLDAQGF